MINVKGDVYMTYLKLVDTFLSALSPGFTTLITDN